MHPRSSVYRKHPIVSALDDDFYKHNMMQVMLHQFQAVETVEYAFKMRADIDLRPFRTEIEDELMRLDGLSLTEDQIQWMKQHPWYSKDYIEYMRLWKFNTRYLDICERDNQLSIRAKGPLLMCTKFEIPVLATISEVYNRNVYPHITYEDIRRPLYQKIEWLRKQQQEHDLTGLTFAEFGTRRRFSYETQHTVVDTLRKELPGVFIGTSNMHLAKEFGIRAIGTMAHEIFMLSQQVGIQLRNFQKHTLEAWVREFRGMLGYALTDIIGMDAFIRDFDLYFAKLFDGLRHDSGCPFQFGTKAYNMYMALKVDPRTKSLTYSNSVNFELMVQLFLEFRDKFIVTFGLGKALSNSVDGVPSMDMVFKLIRVNDRPVAKISDDEGKGMCEDPSFVNYLKGEFRAPNAV